MPASWSQAEGGHTGGIPASALPGLQLQRPGATQCGECQCRGMALGGLRVGGRKKAIAPHQLQ